MFNCRRIATAAFRWRPANCHAASPLGVRPYCCRRSRWPSISAPPDLEGFGFRPFLRWPGVAQPRARFSIISTETQKTSLAHLDRLIPYRVGQTLELDESTRRSLEITRTDPRRTAAKARCSPRSTARRPRWVRARLADWLANPLADFAAIHDALRCGRRIGRRRAVVRRTCEQPFARHPRFAAAAGPA